VLNKWLIIILKVRELKLKAAITFLFLFLMSFQNGTYANIIGPGEVKKLYQSVKPILDQPTPEQPFYLKSGNDKKIESGEAAFYLPLTVEKIADSLSSVHNWCEIMSLHINVKACISNEKNDSMTVYMGRKYYQEPGDAYPLTYHFNTVKKNGYFSAVAIASDGPMGTSDYHIEVEVISVGNRSLGRIYVSNRRSVISSIAMSIYLATKGKNKRGIKVIGHDDLGVPIYSQGEAGVAERNLLRYYFAFLALFVNIGVQDDNKRHEAQLAFWFAQTQPFPQLYEMSEEDYLTGKRKERINQIKLQQTAH